jgi:chromosome segregation protein
MLKAEEEQLDAQRTAVLAEAAALEKDASDVETRIQAIRGEITQGETRNREEQAKLNDLRDQVSALRLSVQSIVESIAAAEEMRQRIAGEKAALESGLRRSEQDAVRGHQDIERLELALNGRSTRMRAVEEETALALAEARTLAERREVLEREQAAYMDRLDQTNVEIGRLQIELGRAEARKGRIEATLDDNRNRLWEEYELTYDNAEGWPREVEYPVAMQREVSDLKRAMKELGDVNIASIEEYTKVGERYGFMQKQRTISKKPAKNWKKSLPISPEKCRRSFWIISESSTRTSVLCSRIFLAGVRRRSSWRTKPMCWTAVLKSGPSHRARNCRT